MPGGVAAQATASEQVAKEMQETCVFIVGVSLRVPQGFQSL